MRRLPTIVFLVLVSGCAAKSALEDPSTAPSSQQGTPTAVPNPTPSVTMVEVPTLPEWDGTCVGIGMNAELHGDADDPRVTWVVERGRRIEIIWPPGYTAQFTPNLVVLNADGEVAAREGDRVDGACVGGPPDYFLLILSGAD